MVAPLQNKALASTRINLEENSPTNPVGNPEVAWASDEEGMQEYMESGGAEASKPNNGLVRTVAWASDEEGMQEYMESGGAEASKPRQRTVAWASDEEGMQEYMESGGAEANINRSTLASTGSPETDDAARDAQQFAPAGSMEA